MQTQQIQSCDTFNRQTTLAPHSVHIQPHCLQGNISQPQYLSLESRSDLTWGSHLSVSSTRPNKHMEMSSCCSTEWNKLLQAIRTQNSINGFRHQLGYPIFHHSPSPLSDTDMDTFFVFVGGGWGGGGGG